MRITLRRTCQVVKIIAAYGMQLVDKKKNIHIPYFCLKIIGQSAFFVEREREFSVSHQCIRRG